MGLFGPPDVDKLKAKGDISGLMKALAYQSDVFVRRDAAVALGQIHSPLAVDALAAALKDANRCVRDAAMAALIRIGSPAVRHLIGIVEGADKEARSAAIGALVKIGRPAIKPLVAYLQRTVYPQPAPNRDYDVVEGLRQIGVPAIKPLIAALDNPYEWHRQPIAVALGQIGASAIEPLLVALHNPNEDRRKGAGEALGRIGPSVVGTLLAAVEGQDEDAREAIAEALGQIGTSAIEPLLVALTDPGEQVRIVAARALGKIRDARAVAPLSNTLAHDVFGPVRAAAAQALGQIGVRDAGQALTTALDDQDSTVREAAYQALKVNGWLFHKVTDYGGIEIVQTTHDGIILATCHHRRWLEIEGGKRLGWGQVREELDFGNRFREVEEPFFSVVKHDCKCGYKGFNL